MSETKKTGIVRFLTIWAGQFLSLIGSGLTGFGLGVWVFQKTGSSTYYALIVLFTVLPGLLATPVGGVLADRYNRKMLMIVSNFGASLAILCLFVLGLTNSLEIWHIYVAMSFASIFTGIQYPAFKAAITDLVPKEFYPQASGLTQAAMGAQFIISPFIAGLMVDGLGINGIMIADFVTFLIAVSTLLVTFIPATRREMQDRTPSFYRDFSESLKYLKTRDGLILLLVILTVTNIFQGLLIVLVGPMILSFDTAKALGVGQSVAGLGMLLTSIYVGIRGIKSKFINYICFFLIVSGISLSLMGIRANIVLIVAFSFFFFFSLPFINASFETIWRIKTKQQMHGRLFAFARTVTQIGLVIGYAIAGPLADLVFEPAFKGQSFLSSVFGPVIGTGKGRGIGFIFIIAGIMMTILAVVIYVLPKIKNLEKHLEDEPLIEDNNLSDNKITEEYQEAEKAEEVVIM